MKRPRKIAEGKTDMNDVARLKHVVELRKSGLLFREIGALLGIGGKYASFLHQLALAKLQAGRLD